LKIFSNPIGYPTQISHVGYEHKASIQIKLYNIYLRVHK